MCYWLCYAKQCAVFCSVTRMAREGGAARDWLLPLMLPGTRILEATPSPNDVDDGGLGGLPAPSAVIVSAKVSCSFALAAASSRSRSWSRRSVHAPKRVVHARIVRHADGRVALEGFGSKQTSFHCPLCSAATHGFDTASDLAIPLPPDSPGHSIGGGSGDCDDLQDSDLDRSPAADFSAVGSDVGVAVTEKNIQ